MPYQSMLLNDPEFMSRLNNGVNNLMAGLDAIDEAFEEPLQIQESVKLEGKIVNGPSKWFDLKHTAEDAVIVEVEATLKHSLTSADMDLRTLKRRIVKFGLIEGEDFVVTIGKHGKKTYTFNEDQIGWVNRRLR